VIPDYQTLMSPLLQAASDGSEKSTREALNVLADQFALTPEEQEKLLPSGNQRIFANRVGWALTYLKKAGLLQGTRKGYFRITPVGSEVLANRREPINNAFLGQFPSFVVFRDGSGDGLTGAAPASTVQSTSITELETPESRIDSARKQLESALVDDLLLRIRTASWLFFEKLVINVLIAMGYGRGADSGEHLGRSGDQGIDGLINEDELGLERIFLQAKHWERKVTAPDLHQFVGALSGQRAAKGVFITTSEFTADAQLFVSTLSTHRVILIDGKQLAGLMVKHGVGVQVTETIHIKRIDSDYFPGEEFS
jgi:restriction system protein